jgi:hypothetical protein
MDEHKEKEEENKFQESPEQLQAPRKQEAEDSSEESIDQQQHNQSGGYKEGMRNAAEDDEEEQTVVVQLKEVVQTGSAPWVLGVFANPCSLLQYLLRACARLCCGLHGAFDDDGPKPQQPPAAAATPEAAVAPANSAEQGDGDKANVKLNFVLLALLFRLPDSID